MFRSCQIIIRELSSLLKLYYIIQNFLLNYFNYFNPTIIVLQLQGFPVLYMFFSV